MKQLKYLLMMALVAFTAVSCLTGKGFEEDMTGPEQQIKLTLSANKALIVADGEDYAQLYVKLGNQEISIEEVELLYSADNTPVEVAGDKFSALAAGTYTFHATYTDDEGVFYKSNELSIRATEQNTNEGLDVNLDDLADEKEGNDLSLKASSNIYQAGVDKVYFVVRYNGIVVRNPEIEQDFRGNKQTIKYQILDYETMAPIELEWVEEERNGETYRLYWYSASQAEARTFFVMFNALNTYDTPLTLKGLPMAIPPRLADPEPANTDFKHRAFMMQFTGLGCTWCPQMIAAIEDIMEKEGYNEKAALAVAHTYDGDPFAPEENLGVMAGQGYPYVNLDFAVGVGNYGYADNKANLKTYIDLRTANPAKAGISATMALEGNSLLVRMTVKAAQTAKFRVGAWLLEDGLTGKQTNTSMPDDGTYDFNTHNNVVRKAHSVNPKGGFTGHDLDEFAELQAGEYGDFLFDFTIDPSWVKENCHLVLFVSAPTDGGYTVTNAIGTSSLIEPVEFDYN